MNKWVRIGFPIFCVAVVGGTLIAVGNLKKQADKISAERKLANVTSGYNYSNTNNYYNNTIEYEDDYNSIKESNANFTNYSNTNFTNVLNTNINTNTNTNTNTNNNNTSKINTSVIDTSNDNKTNTHTEETTDDLSYTDDKEKAVALVADEWGEDSSVYYTNEGVSSGYYIVAVRDKSNTSVKMFYKVDVKNETVEVDW